MPEITIRIQDKIARAEGEPVIVCGNSDYTVRFTADAEWGAYPVRTARFAFVRGGTALYQDVLLDGDTCSVPVLRDVYEVSVGLFAGNIRTTTPARIPCARCITDGSLPHPAPAPDIYEQLLTLLEAMQQDSAPPPAAAVFCAAGQISDTVGSAESEEVSCPSSAI